MIGRKAIGFALALVLLPPIPAQPGLEELQFGRVTFTVYSDAVEVYAEDFQITGSAAADWRECIDGGNCPVPELQQLERGNEDNQVSSDEVNAFEDLIMTVISSVDQFDQARDTLKLLIAIDGHPADRMGFESLQLHDAEGTVSSTSPIDVEVGLMGEYLSVGPSEIHEISIQRTQSDLMLAQWIVIRPGSGWAIDQSSVAPAGLQGYWNDGRLEGTQDNFEGSEPMTFTIHEDSGPGAAVWLGLGAGVLAAAGVAGFVIWKRRNA